jgi:protein O-GlcNAc transferase
MPAPLLAQALQSFRAGDRLRAAALCRTAIQMETGPADAHRLLAEIEDAAGNIDAAAVACEQVAALAPRDAGNLRRWAILASRQGRPQEAAALLEKSLCLEPDNARALNNLANLLIALHRPGEAVEMLQRALAAQPDYAVAHNNLGNALAQLGRLEEAVEQYRRALALNHGFLEALMNLAGALSTLGRPSEALSQLDRVVALDPKHVSAHSARGRALAALGRGAEAIAAHRAAAQLNPRDAEVFIEMGRLMLQLRFSVNAHAAFTAALELLPGDVRAQEGLVMSLMLTNRYEEAVQAIAVLRRMAPENHYLQGHQLHAQLHCADWRDLETESRDITERVRRGEHMDLPMAFMAHNDSPADQLACARIYVEDRRPRDSVDPATAATANATTSTVAAVRPARRPASEPLRVAYLSADFGDHPVGQLIVGIIESHDRNRFETHVLSAGRDDAGEVRRRIESGCDHFLDVSALSDRDVARIIRERGIDIAIDLGGHTLGSRALLLAYRPAPLQISFLGFPGTLGADFIDYIIADRWVIPEEDQRHYSEKVIYLPNSYLPGTAAEPVLAAPARSDAGLPLNGFVYGCFHAVYKILPAAFDSWMRILQSVPDSVLWLRDTDALVKSNLAREAALRGMDPARFVYAAKTATPADHRARLSLADVFLDTRPYNAHSTAIDALAAGVPVITLPGRSFASRVAGSLLQACGLERLSAQTAGQYEQLAIDLARAPEELAGIKAHLRREYASRLADTREFCRRLEAAYGEIWARHARGEPPSPLYISPRRTADACENGTGS